MRIYTVQVGTEDLIKVSASTAKEAAQKFLDERDPALPVVIAFKIILNEDYRIVSVGYPYVRSF